MSFLRFNVSVAQFTLFCVAYQVKFDKQTSRGVSRDRQYPKSAAFEFRSNLDKQSDFKDRHSFQILYHARPPGIGKAIKDTIEI